jgi:hypothetical protein
MWMGVGVAHWRMVLPPRNLGHGGWLLTTPFFSFSFFSLFFYFCIVAFQNHIAKLFSANLTTCIHVKMLLNMMWPSTYVSLLTSGLASVFTVITDITHPCRHHLVSAFQCRQPLPAPMIMSPASPSVDDFVSCSPFSGDF